MKVGTLVREKGRQRVGVVIAHDESFCMFTHTVMWFFLNTVFRHHTTNSIRELEELPEEEVAIYAIAGALNFLKEYK